MSSSLRGQCHDSRWTPELARLVRKEQSDGEVSALSPAVGHASLLRELFAHFADLDPGIIGFEDRGGLFSRLKNKDAAA